jgi:hypothetical protein
LKIPLLGAIEVKVSGAPESEVAVAVKLVLKTERLAIAGMVTVSVAS